MKRLSFFLFIWVFVFTALVIGYYKTFVKADFQEVEASTSGTFWKYQCIDTMKTSRDKARAWANDNKLEERVAKEMLAIKGMGGNCVAIATPYDDEFLPYLRVWVAEARKQNLIVWFRGNFSSWEGWFEYPKGMTTEQHNEKTKTFIAKNADLFQDGDVFSPSPEAENGGPFNQVELDEHEAFRTYLIEEYQTAKDAFASINKHVEVRWLSMNGGLAMRMFDKTTVDGVGGVVSIDHYIKTKEEMSQFITYFHDNFGARISIGEFGAPIPEINGSMTQKEQAAFVDSLLFEIYKHKDIVDGLSYWVLYDGSTALLNPDYSERPVVSSVRKYFQPGIVSGTVTDIFERPVQNVVVTASDGVGKTVTNVNGRFALTLPTGNYALTFSALNYKTIEEEMTVNSNEDKKLTVEVEHVKATRLDSVRIMLENLQQNFTPNN